MDCTFLTSPVRFAADSIRKQGFRLMCGDSELRLCVDLRHLSNGFYRTLGYNLTEFPRCRISRSEYAVGVLGPPATSGYNPYVIAIVSRWNHDVLLGRNRLLRKLGVLPASLIYQWRKSFKGALLGMIIGTVSLTIIGSAFNYFVLIPFYAKALFPMDAIIAMSSKVNPNIDGLLTLVLFATVPFNLVKGVVCSVAALLVYKRVSPILHKDFKNN